VAEWQASGGGREARVRTRVAFGLLLAVVACGGDDDGGDASLDTSLRRPSLDAGAHMSAALDGGTYVSESDAASLIACSSLDVCRDGKVTGLFNVCFATSGAATTGHTCLVDPNGTVYLATLTGGQQIANVGWHQTGGTGEAALSADEATRCEAAIAALTADAGVCSATP